MHLRRQGPRGARRRRPRRHQRDERDRDLQPGVQRELRPGPGAGIVRVAVNVNVNALRGLERERGDIEPLEGPLDGYCRLRVGGYRIVLAYTGSGRVQCVLAERRSIVYEVFALALSAALSGKNE